jgi:heptosyltransferase-2
LKRILVIQTAFIGDVVLATGIVEQLHQWYPQVSIDFLLRKGNEALLKQHPLINEVLVWDKKNERYKDLYRILKLVRQRRYDVVVNVQRFASTGLVTALSGAKITIGFDKNPFSRAFTHRIQHIVQQQNGTVLHETERNLALIKPLQPDPSEPLKALKPKLYPSIEDTEKIRDYQIIPYITISPASIWFTKMFPVEKWVELIQQIPAQYRIYLLGGPADKTLAEKIIALTQRNEIVTLCGQLSFLQSAALMKTAVMNYVNDSAPMHFASSVNAPVTAVYCSTLPGFGFGPLSDQSTVVETKVALHCRPCGLHGHAKCPENHFKCAYTIAVSDLLKPIGEKIK